MTCDHCKEHDSTKCILIKHWDNYYICKDCEPIIRPLLALDFLDPNANQMPCFLQTLFKPVIVYAFPDFKSLFKRLTTMKSTNALDEEKYKYGIESNDHKFIWKRTLVELYDLVHSSDSLNLENIIWVPKWEFLELQKLKLIAKTKKLELKANTIKAMKKADTNRCDILWHMINQSVDLSK